MTALEQTRVPYTALPITVGSAQFPGSATFFGPSEGHDSAIVKAGAAFQLTPRFSIPPRRGERRPHPPNLTVCVRSPKIADRLGVANPLSRRDTESFGLCDVSYVSFR
jgi:hypothetical protein